MEIGLRGWLIIGGILVIALILIDGWRRISGNRNRIRLKIDHSVLGDDSAEEVPRHSNPELPNGGARRRNGDERLEPRFGGEAAAPPARKRRASAEVTSESDQRISLSDMDPLFDDVPVEQGPRARRTSTSRTVPPKPEVTQNSGHSQAEFDDQSRGGGADEASQKEYSARPDRADARYQDSDQPDSMSLEFDPERPIPVLKERVQQSATEQGKAVASQEDERLAQAAAAGAGSRRGKPADADAADAAEVAPEQSFALELDEATTAETRMESAEPHAASSAEAADSESAASAGDSAGQKRPNPEISADPEEMLVIFVVGRDKQPLPGAAIRKIVEACGMEFGEMGIYHRHEGPNAEGSLQFSMANAIQPGTFDLETIDSMETPAVTFFMSMRDPADPLYAYECMLATAETLCRHLDAELLDGDRSVMRPQTKEHYRERIHDFELHQRVKRAH